MPDVRTRVYSSAERILNRMAALVGNDRELSELSTKITELKSSVYADKRLSPDELMAVQKKMADIEAAFTQFASERGYPVGSQKPADPKSFRIYQEQQEIHYQWLAGKDLRGGALGQLNDALKSRDAGRIDGLTKQIANDLLTSSTPAHAAEKVNLLRASLARTNDPTAQRDVLAQVGKRLEENLGGALNRDWFRSQGKEPPITPAAYEKLATYDTKVAVHHTPLPAEVRGNKPFPNKPLPGWEATTRAATRAAFDDLARSGQLFIAKIPQGAGPADVALKLDLNFGADGPPTVSDPTSTSATILELAARAKAEGKTLHFTVGDSCGGENVGIGRTTMDIMKDTGNYHYALKAGLTLASEGGSAEATAALARLKSVEQSGVFFGSKNDKVSKPADLAAAERAAQPWVTCVDYDKAGYTPVDPQLGPVGLASWGTRSFNIAKPWVEADYRVHVTRSTSTHLLAGWTGPTKGLIGLHAFGTRPVDQGMDKRGQDLLGGLGLLAGMTGFMSMLQGRTGFDLMGNAGNSAEARDVKAKWDICERFSANGTFQQDVAKLQKDLKREQQAGLPQPELMERLRLGVRAALDRAEARDPGFRQAYWDAADASTRLMYKVAPPFRELIPAEMRDVQAGNRIGLLSQLPYQSDLVVTAMTKMGEGGGPDAYNNYKDVGAVIAGTSEVAMDAMAWKLAGKTDNLWSSNPPVDAAVMYGRGPMNHEEIDVVTR